MPIDASRNPYDSPRFDTGGDKAIRPDSAGKDELDDDLDDALDDLGGGAKVPVGDDADAGDEADVDADVDADLDLAGTGSKGAVDLDEVGGDAAKGGLIEGLSSSVGDVVDDLKGAFDLGDAEADLADSGTGAKGAVFLDEGDDGLDDLGQDAKVLGGEADDLDLDGAKGTGLDDVDVDDDGGGAFGADLGEVPDLGDKGAFDDDASLFEQKGSILDAVAEDMREGLDDDPDDVDF